MISNSVIDELKRHALEAAGAAYCPYSGFAVGAAVLAENGAIFAGCNVENASYGLTICAERNAVFQAVAKGASRVVAVAIYTPTGEPTFPCGACRQVINEFGPDADVFCFCDGPDILHHKIGDLLPHTFGAANLEYD